MGDAINLECPDCKRTLRVERVDTDPPAAIRAVLQCDRCDDGDRHSPEFFDADGNWVPDDYRPSPSIEAEISRLNSEDQVTV